MENKRARKNIPKKDQLLIWMRDNWHCRYCSAPVFFPPFLKLLNKINPNHLYYHPNGKEGEILELFQWGWATIDHINPVTLGGKNIFSNYVTSCWKCNLMYKNKPVGIGKPEPHSRIESKWDGFCGAYLHVLKLMGKKRDEWAKILENSYV